MAASLYRERADWAYVKSTWGGVVLDRVEKDGEGATLLFRLFLDGAQRIDSAICINHLNYYKSENVIMVSIIKGPCSVGSLKELRASVGDVKPGSYVVRYDDVIAGSPVIGSFEL